jgi:hypothetical protein
LKNLTINNNKKSPLISINVALSIHNMMYKCTLDCTDTIPFWIFQKNTIFIKVLVRRNNIIITQMWQGHRCFYCDSSIVLEREDMVLYKANIAKGKLWNMFPFKIWKMPYIYYWSVWILLTFDFWPTPTYTSFKI